MFESPKLCYSSKELGVLFSNQVLPSGAHAGLVFDRFLDIWEDKSGSISRKELYKPLKEFVDAFNKRKDSTQFKTVLERLTTRMDRIFEHLSTGKAVYGVQWRLACGLGNDHPTENGFSFDPIVGVPILTGSSIKGLCRATAKFDNLEETEIDRLFGPEIIAEGQAAATGALCFYDAYPFEWPRLRVDIVNCHHTEYYSSNEDRTKTSAKNIPFETESPNPVFFLTVDKGSQFVFRISSRKESRQDINTAFNILENGLTLFGIGSKTAVGYGVFEKG